MEIQFQQMVEEYAPSLYRLAYSYCLNRADAEDVVQEVFLKYLQHPPACAASEQLRAWLMTVTANTSKNLLSSGWRRKKQPLEDDLTASEHFDEVVEVRLALEKLPPNLRGAVHLFYFEQLSVRQIAEILHLSETAVHSRLFRARKQLKKLLGGD